MTQMCVDTSLRRNPDLIAIDMDGEMVMISVERGEYYGIGGVGSLVREQLVKSLTLGEIVLTIFDEFEVDEQTCQADMLAFFENLGHNNLVSVG